MPYPADWDPYWGAVVLGLHGDGNDGGTSLPDVKGKSVTRFGSAQTKTAIKQFGTASIFFDGAGDYLTLADSNDWAFGAGDFTIDGWFRQASNASGSYYGLVTQRTSTSSQNAFALYISGSGQLIAELSTSGTATTHSASCAFTNDTTTFHHFALVRSGAEVSVYVDGVKGASVANIGSSSLFDSTSVLRIGTDWNDAAVSSFNGYLDDLRITKGFARYVANFPVPTGAFGEKGPVLALHMDGVDNGTVFTDELGRAVTVGGNVVTKTAVKKFGTASAFFDGSGDYLQFADSNDWWFGAGDFTIEMWFRQAVNVAGGFYGLLSQRTSAGSANSFSVYVNGNGFISAELSTTGTGVTHTASKAFTPDTTTFHHVAVVRTASVVTIYLDGVAGETVANIGSSSLHNSISQLRVGSDWNSGPYRVFNGYIDDVLILKGYAKYTENFTPPSSPWQIPEAGDTGSTSIAASGTTAFNAHGLIVAAYGLQGVASANLVSEVKEAILDIIGAADLSGVADAFAYSVLQALCGSATSFVHDDRELILLCSSQVSPSAKGLLDSVGSAGGVGALDAEVLGFLSAALDSIGATDVAGVAQAQWDALMLSRGRGALDPLMSHNKDARVIVIAGSRGALVSDGNELRVISITGESRVLFRGPEAECILRMALPFDRIVPRVLKAKSRAMFVAHTDIPGDQVLTIRSKASVLFKPLENKLRCAKMITKPRARARFGGSYG